MVSTFRDMTLQDRSAAAANCSARWACCRPTSGPGVQILLYAAGVRVVVVNPRWLRHLAQGMGWLEKTDRIDARLLALYAERAELKVQQLPDEATRRLAELCAWRLDLLAMMESERNRLEHASSAVAGAINRQPRQSLVS